MQLQLLLVLIEEKSKLLFLVFDLSSPATFEAVLKWRDDVNQKVVLANNQPIPALLLANKVSISEVSSGFNFIKKSDLPGVVVDKEMLDKFCRDHGFVGWFETSAKNDTNIGIVKSHKFYIDCFLQMKR
jgi:Ras-related protein Rab-32